MSGKRQGKTSSSQNKVNKQKNRTRSGHTKITTQPQKAGKKASVKHLKKALSKKKISTTKPSTSNASKPLSINKPKHKVAKPKEKSTPTKNKNLASKRVSANKARTFIKSKKAKKPAASIQPATKPKQSRLEARKTPTKKLPVRKKMPKNRWVDGEREPIIYTCGRCKKTVELFLPARVVCSKCRNVMKTPEAS